VQVLVHEASEAVSELAEQTQHPTGLIRISASLGIGESLLAPMVWEFINDHPKVRVEMILTDDLVDLVADGIDFTLRMGDLQDSELMAKSLGKARRILIVAPKCLSQHPMPSKPEDLRRIPAIVTTPAHGFWHFANGEIVRVNWRIAAGSYRVVLDACLFGHGVALLPEEFARPHIETGKLVQLLEKYPLPEVSINLVYPRVKHQTAAARAFRAALDQLKK
jgi:DNA-binding transcriptional LysR family regulator